MRGLFENTPVARSETLGVCGEAGLCSREGRGEARGRTTRAGPSKHTRVSHSSRAGYTPLLREAPAGGSVAAPVRPRARGGVSLGGAQSCGHLRRAHFCCRSCFSRRARQCSAVSGIARQFQLKDFEMSEYARA